MTWCQKGEEIFENFDTASDQEFSTICTVRRHSRIRREMTYRINIIRSITPIYFQFRGVLGFWGLKVSNIFCVQTVGYIIFSDIISLQFHPGVQAVPRFELVKPLQEHARPGARGGSGVNGDHLFADVV